MTRLTDCVEPWEPAPARMQRLMLREQRLSERSPVLFPLAVWVNRARRRWQWTVGETEWAATRSGSDLEVRVKEHRSLLVRRLGESEMYLQHNKVTNLALAASKVDGLLIAPGEAFSFNKVYGQNERFYRLGGEHFRANQIWRTVIDRRTGNRLGEELVRSNCALVKYLPEGAPIHELTPTDGELADAPRESLNRLETGPPVSSSG